MTTRTKKTPGKLGSNAGRKRIRGSSRPISDPRSAGKSFDEVEQHLSAAFDCLCQAIETYRDKKKGGQ